jgi:hypothetical protein
VPTYGTSADSILMATPMRKIPPKINSPAE